MTFLRNEILFYSNLNNLSYFYVKLFKISPRTLEKHLLWTATTLLCRVLTFDFNTFPIPSMLMMSFNPGLPPVRVALSRRVLEISWCYFNLCFYFLSFFLSSFLRISCFPCTYLIVFLVVCFISIWYLLYALLASCLS